MKALVFMMAAAAGLNFAAASAVGLGSGGPQTGNPSNSGGGTIEGTTPEQPVSQWAAMVLAAYADGTLSPSERRGMVRFLRTVPRFHRSRYVASWGMLHHQVARHRDPAAVSGLLAAWALSDPAIAASWLNNLPGR